MKSNDSVITCDEFIDMPETVLIDTIKKKTRHKINYYSFHTILLVTIYFLLLIIIAINRYCVKHPLKQKDILPC